MACPAVRGGRLQRLGIRPDQRLGAGPVGVGAAPGPRRRDLCRHGPRHCDGGRLLCCGCRPGRHDAVALAGAGGPGGGRHRAIAPAERRRPGSRDRRGPGGRRFGPARRQDRRPGRLLRGDGARLYPAGHVPSHAGPQHCRRAAHIRPSPGRCSGWRPWFPPSWPHVCSGG